MPLDISNFRRDDGQPSSKLLDALKASQAARFADEKLVDNVTNWDEQWRKLKFDEEQLRKDKNKKSKEIGLLMRDGKESETVALRQQVVACDEQIAVLQVQVKALEDQIDNGLRRVGNLVHSSVPVSKDEANNRVERTWGETKRTGKERHHHELLHMIDGYAPEQGVSVAGHRGYFLKGPGVLLNQALINYGISFLMAHQYTPIQPPFFMLRSVMAKTAQLEQFDEELYKVSTYSAESKKEAGEKVPEDMYLIATSEQPISAFHQNEWLQPQDLPIRYAGISSCFRKEAGSHGRDVWGIFRVHQFEKVEQFVITDPEKSWEMQEEMIGLAEKFYQSLGFSYRVINIVSGELNNAAARKYDLEAWFPTLGVFRELVSCSNCTDYQARAMETRFGQKKMGDREKTYAHMLNATLTATERTICCILENYQTEDGIIVPEKLRPFMGGMEKIPFVKPPPPASDEKKKK